MNLPIIDLTSPDRLSTATSLRQACIEYGFFYVVNHGLENDFDKAFDESKRFFSLPLQHKMNLVRKEFGGYSPVDPSLGFRGDSKESFYVGPIADPTSAKFNQWPPEEVLPNWRPSIESLYWKLFEAGKKVLSLIALSLNIDEDFFEKIGAIDRPSAFLFLIHYPDPSMLTLILTDGVPGLQICRDKLKEPQVWEDVSHLEGALIVNIGDLMERWTNCLYRSTMHQVKGTGKDRYSLPFFLDAHPDCIVECIKSCCSESSPPRKEISATMNLPIIDLTSPDRLSTATSLRQACIEYGFFYVVNHGVENDLVKAFDESRRFFSLPLQHKMNLARKEFRGYTPLDNALGFQVDSKESYYIGPMADSTSAKLNQWPSEDLLGNWRPSMESFYWKLFGAGKKVLSLIALSLNIDEDFFEKIGAIDKPSAFLRLMRYPGEMGSNEVICSAHSDPCMLTLLMTDEVPGLQICRDKLKEPQVWEDVSQLEGALIVNIGDLMERWTNCLYRSTMHRVKGTGKERYSACIEYGFFYLVNHGVENDSVKAFDESRRFFSLPLQDKLQLAYKEHRGYSPLDPTLGSKGEMGPHEEICSAHSDFGTLTLLVTNGVPGLQICRDKLEEPRVWEDVSHIEGAFIVNIGDLMERWTNCLYRSTMHRVKRTGKERYSMALFLDPHPDCVVECLESCCSELSPPRFAPIRSGDYLNERFRVSPV
ncbi:encD [Mucuna pruriens]|uniref:EncD n=1 Tax=Mucuna pruriens TaxID=157652 RepID=A0A371FG98_MUCPR|nr:encD [Mucuna pruriens]